MKYYINTQLKFYFLCGPSNIIFLLLESFLLVCLVNSHPSRALK